MPNDGNRICLDATPGNENIEVCDQHGNQVILHASNELIKIFAPYKNSGMELGKTSYEPGYGVYIYTDGKYKLKAKDQYIKEIDTDSITTVKADYETTVIGHYQTMVGGYYTTLVGGLYTTVAGGLYTSMALAGKIESCIGLKVESCIGLKVDLSYAYKYTACKTGELNESLDMKNKVLNYETTAECVAAIKACCVSISGTNVQLQGDSVNVNKGVFVVKN